jgi:glucose/arabinose dehydrogenase
MRAMSERGVAAASLAVALYNGPEFPVRCRAGVFVAFHGSWNRAPFPQGGYNVVFPSLAHGRGASRYEVFADGFAGAVADLIPGRSRRWPHTSDRSTRRPDERRHILKRTEDAHE